ncbi:O-antigen translocase [Pirellulaceae bacterium SH449]
MSVADDLVQSAKNSEETPSREEVTQQPQDSESSYRQILKSSSIIGGAQVINMVIGLIRTKMVAVLIGPTGIGLLAIYQSITTLASTIAGLGINTSGVREVARFDACGDAENVAKTVRTLRRVCWFTGISGMLLLAALSPWISQISFGSRDHAWAISLLGFTILFGNITAGQGAIIQGTRRIGDIAKISIWSAFIGTIVSIGFYWNMGLNGIVPALTALSIASLFISTYYARQIKIVDTIPKWSETLCQSRHLVRFGIAMVINGIMITGVAYVTRLMIIQEFNFVGVGIYSAAFSLSGLFVQFVLSAMGADFYPRLTAAPNDHPRMVKLINEQTEVGLLLVFPGLLAILVFAPLLVQVLYTSEFGEAARLLQWFVIGCFGRVLSWPLGFGLLAKGQSALYIVTEVLFNLLHISLIWIGLKTLGLLGPSVAFALLYVVYAAAVLMINRVLIEFRWSSNVCKSLFWMIPSVFVLLTLSRDMPRSAMLLSGGMITLVCSSICLHQLANRLGAEHPLMKILKRK